MNTPGKTRVLLFTLLLAACSLRAETLHRGNGVEPESLDPHRGRGVETMNILRDLYEGLTRYDAVGDVEPGMAEGWEISADGREYRFHLRDDARWSDGRPVSAEDFALALRRAVDPATAAPYAKVLEILDGAAAILAGENEDLGVKVVNPRELVLRLREPAPQLLQVLALPVAFPLPGHLPEADWARATVSNGAYRLVSHRVHDHLELAQNPHYWSRETVRIARLRYYPTDDQAAELARFRAGELHITATLPTRRITSLRQSHPAALRITPYLGTYFYGFNLTRPPFKNAPGLRRALSMVIDREVLAERVLASGDQPAWSWIPPGIEGYPAARLDYADMDHGAKLAEARRLYAAAGYGPANPLRIELRFNSGDNHRRVAIAIAAMWKQALGVETKLVNEEWKVFIQNRRQQVVTQVYRSSWIGDYNDPWTFAEVMLADHGINDFGFRNERYESLMKQAAKQREPERYRLLREAEQLALDEHPIIPLFFYVSKHLVDPRLGGWVDNALDVHLSQYLYFKE